MLRRVVLLAILLFAAVSAQAQAPATDIAAADRAAIRQIIGDQIAAFRRDDGPGAFAFASPTIQAMFGTPDIFMDMVRNGYQPVYRPQSVSFTDLVYIDGQAHPACRHRRAGWRAGGRGLRAGATARRHLAHQRLPDPARAQRIAAASVPAVASPRTIGLNPPAFERRESAMAEDYKKMFPVSWQELHRDAKALAWKLVAGGPWLGIVAITRGGLVPAAIVARELDLRVVDTVSVASYEHMTQGEARILKQIAIDIKSGTTGKGRWLIIDDLVDTGRTAKVVRDLMPGAHLATVYAKPLGKPLVDTYMTEVSQDTWIMFPWDTEPQFVRPIAAEKVPS